MSKRSAINNFLVGSARIEDRTEYKMAVLRGQLILLLAFTCTFYLILDPINGLFLYIPIYIVGIATSVWGVYLNRAGKGKNASILILVLTNTLIFLVADASGPESGVFFFFAAMSLIGLILFYHKNLKYGIVFMLLPILLAIGAYFNNNPLLEQTVLTGGTRDFNFLLNMSLGSVTSIVILLFIIRRNKESETSLINSKNRLEKISKEVSEKNKELQKTNDELDSFVYSASHDLRAPLATLLGLIAVVRTTEDKNEWLSYSDMMEARIHDMEGFIQDVTDYSRNSRLEINTERIKLNEFLIEIVKSFDFEINEAKIKLEINVKPNFELVSDPHRLKVVLNNLILNAIKYHDPNKTTPSIKISSSLNNDSVEISIEDNGIGINEEYQSQVFDMFFRASEKSKGSGLGLYIVKETLEKISGEIHLVSDVGEGSKFTIILRS